LPAADGATSFRFRLYPIAGAGIPARKFTRAGRNPTDDGQPFALFGFFDLPSDFAIREFCGVDIDVPLPGLEIGNLLIAYIG
jgi:hypothetical protein